MLIKRKDSLRLFSHGKDVLISQLGIFGPPGILEVTGQTWQSFNQEKAWLEFSYRDSLGNSDSLALQLPVKDLAGVFVRQEFTPTPPDPWAGTGLAEINRKSGRGTGVAMVMLGPIIGFTVGALYGHFQGSGSYSHPGTETYVYGMAGMLTGLVYGVLFAFQ